MSAAYLVLSASSLTQAPLSLRSAWEGHQWWETKAVLALELDLRTPVSLAAFADAGVSLLVGYVFTTMALCS